MNRNIISVGKQDVTGGSQVMKKQSIMLLIAICMTLLASPALLNGQSAQSARSLGMADSYLMLSSDCEAALVNPANLALPGRANYSLKLFSFSGQFNNNAFSLSDYNKYNGEFLSESDKRDILAKIPDDGLSLDADLTASALSFSFKSFVLSFEGIGGGDGTMPKDPIELILMGNRIGQPVSAAGSGGSAWSAAAVGISYGTHILTVPGWQINAGATLKYLRGLGYAEADGLTAEAVTLETGFAGSGGITTFEALGGSGYAFDLGFAAQGGSTQLGLIFRNFLAAINWDKDVKRRVYNFHFDSVTVDNSGEDSIWSSTEEVYELGSFKTRPPLELELGAARHFGKLLAAASWRQGFTATAFVSRKPRVGVGVEYPLIKQFDVRTGFAIGGAEGKSAAVGLGLNLGPCHVDAGYASASRLVPWGGNGGQFAVSMIFDF